MSVSGKRFFEEMKGKVAYVEKGGDIKLLQTSLNMRITGSPGTGKTSLARLLFRYLHAYGVLPKNVFIEKNGLEMKGKFVGHTAPTVKEAIAEAMGGCLFLDEAYALADSEDGFSGEAVRTLLTEVENNRTSLMVVLAGYKDKMSKLMRADPGMPRRFPNEIHLEDYSAAQLAAIAHGVATSKFALPWEDGLEEQLACHILDRYQHDIASQNGGLAVNLVERALSNYAARVSKSGVDPSKPHAMVASDFGIEAAATFDWSKLESATEPTVRTATADDIEVMSSVSVDSELDEFCRVTSAPGGSTLTRSSTAPLSRAQAAVGRKQTYAIQAHAASHFGGRMKMLTSEEWLADIERLRSHSQFKRTSRTAASINSTPPLVLNSRLDKGAAKQSAEARVDSD
eukprot:COSAG03_NODE_4579_length_1504_cov_1.740214_2_plen_398_part_01